MGSRLKSLPGNSKFMVQSFTFTDLSVLIALAVVGTILYAYSCMNAYSQPLVTWFLASTLVMQVLYLWVSNHPVNTQTGGIPHQVFGISKEPERGCLKGDNSGSLCRPKYVSFDSTHGNPTQFLGFAYPLDLYDRKPLIPDRPTCLVDMMTYVMASLPTNYSDSLDDYQRSFFTKMVLRAYTCSTFGSEGWAEGHEPFFSQCVDTYVKFEEALKNETLAKIKFELEECASKSRELTLEEHLNRVIGIIPSPTQQKIEDGLKQQLEVTVDTATCP
jgi:hypothetical protein